MLLHYRVATLMSAKHAINDKLQSSLATYLRRGGVVNNQIKKVYCWICEWIFLMDEYLAELQAITCLVHFARLANTLLKDGKSVRDH